MRRNHNRAAWRWRRGKGRVPWVDLRVGDGPDDWGAVIAQVRVGKTTRLWGHYGTLTAVRRDHLPGALSIKLPHA